MSSDDLSASFRSKLADIERENGERLSLIGSRVTKALQESKEASDKQLRTVGEVVVRMQESARRAQKAGGWVMESTVGDKADSERDFGFEEDDAEKDRRAGYRAAGEHAVPPVVAPPVVQPAAPPPVPGRHRRGAAHPDEDDFANTDWLAT
ncbi:hypothetical protein [Amycolatopsis saalfeldensis]|uniref:Uncharacterized protein n=1 Tax=Amycolatopsis saalfeldensis TaxID=394193 RepID=A0A1H8YHR3_9PSEU|nr:hypothetical protein [Amycolatopsis saalfeldensis]SEP51695.1 hypothetical protein SAMN04489732_11713 [Amycolatopsis saalfeldensis]